jgi:hypothetical protein
LLRKLPKGTSSEIYLDNFPNKSGYHIAEQQKELRFKTQYPLSARPPEMVRSQIENYINDLKKDKYKQCPLNVEVI